MSDEEEKKIAIVDASNVAHSSEGERARLENIVLVCEKLTEEGFEPIVLADAALRHQIDDSRTYEEMVDDGKIRQAPAGTDADFFILSFARELDRSEEHTSELQSRLHLVCRLLLEKKKEKLTQ